MAVIDPFAQQDGSEEPQGEGLLPAASPKTIIDPYSASYTPTPTPTLAGEFSKGVMTGVKGLQQAGYGVAGLAGEGLKGLGAERMGEAVAQFGLEGAQKTAEEAQKYAPAVGGITDIESPREAALWATGGLGQLLPFAATSVLGGGAGALAARGAAQAAAARVAGQAVARGASTELASALGAEAAKQAVQRGAVTGLAATSVPTEQGLIYTDVYEQTGERAPLAALGYGALAGALDVLPEMRIAGALVRPAVRSGILREAGKQAVAEGITEGAQTYIEAQPAASINPQLTPKWQDILNATALGALGGGVTGGAAAAIPQYNPPAGLIPQPQAAAGAPLEQFALLPNQEPLRTYQFPDGSETGDPAIAREWIGRQTSALPEGQQRYAGRDLLDKLITGDWTESERRSAISAPAPIQTPPGGFGERLTYKEWLAREHPEIESLKDFSDESHKQLTSEYKTYQKQIGDEREKAIAAQEPGIGIPSGRAALPDERAGAIQRYDETVPARRQEAAQAEAKVPLESLIDQAEQLEPGMRGVIEGAITRRGMSDEDQRRYVQEYLDWRRGQQRAETVRRSEEVIPETRPTREEGIVPGGSDLRIQREEPKGEIPAGKEPTQGLTPELPEEDLRRLFDREQELHRKLPRNIGKAQQEGKLSKGQLAALDEIRRIEQQIPWNHPYREERLAAGRTAHTGKTAQWRADLQKRTDHLLSEKGFTEGERVWMQSPAMIPGAPATRYEGVIKISKNGNVYVHTPRGNYDLGRNPWRKLAPEGETPIERAAKATPTPPVALPPSKAEAPGLAPLPEPSSGMGQKERVPAKQQAQPPAETPIDYADIKKQLLSDPDDATFNEIVRNIKLARSPDAGIDDRAVNRIGSILGHKDLARDMNRAGAEFTARKAVSFAKTGMESKATEKKAASQLREKVKKEIAGAEKRLLEGTHTEKDMEILQLDRRRKESLREAQKLDEQAERMQPERDRDKAAGYRGKATDARAAARKASDDISKIVSPPAPEPAQIVPPKAEAPAGRAEGKQPEVKRATPEKRGASPEKSELDKEVEKVFGNDVAPADDPKLVAAQRSVVGTLERLRRLPGTVLGASIAKDFTESKITSLIGKRISNSRELAVLGQIFRNPAFETFRVFMMRGSTIVGETAVSSRLPGTSAIAAGRYEGGDFIKGIKALAEQMKALNADGYYLLHNHPSGNPKPSKADIAATETFGSNMDGLKGFRGHIVIDQTQFGVIAHAGNGKMNSSIRNLPKETYQAEGRYDVAVGKAIPHPLLGTFVADPTHLAKIGKELGNRDNWFQLIGTNRNGIVAIADVPNSILDRAPMRLAAEMRRFARTTGSIDTFAINIPKASEARMRGAIKNGLLEDAHIRGTENTLRSPPIGVGPIVTGRMGRAFARGVSVGEEGQYADKSTAMQQDMERQAAYLLSAAKQDGYGSVDDWLAKKPDGFFAAAAKWREQNPAKFSRRGIERPVTGISRTRAESAVDEFMREYKGGPTISINLHNKQEDFLKEHNLPLSGQGVIKAAALPDGSVAIILENVRDPLELKAKLDHEIIGHHGLSALLGAQFDKILDATIGGAKTDGTLKALHDEVLRQQGAWIKGDQKAIAEEMLAMAAEFRLDTPLINRVIGMIRTALRNIGLIRGALSMDEVRSLIAGSAANLRRADYKSGGRLFSRYARDSGAASTYSRKSPPEGYAAGVLQMLANEQRDSLFHYPRVERKELAGIAMEIDPAMKVGAYKEATSGDKFLYDNIDGSYKVTMPDGRSAQIMQYKDTVWVNAALLEKGRSLGSALYALAGTYARNNGRVLIGDPLGVSATALRRRTEHMLSLALKFGGDTSFMVPDEGQDVPWKIGDDQKNLENLIKRSQEMIKGDFPAIEGIEYDFAKGRFVYRGTSKTVSDDHFRDLARAAREGEREPSVGPTTLKRAAYINSLVRQAGNGAWKAVMESVGRQLGEGLDPAAAKIFYSRSAPDIKDSISNFFLDRFGKESKIETVNFLNRTINTPYHLAQKFPEFRPVFQRAMDYQFDVSQLAQQSEKLAPDVFKRLESFREAIPGLAKTGTASRADLDKAGDAVLAGTHIDQKIYTDAELRSKHGLTDKQIAIYRQIIGSAHDSVDELARSAMAKRAMIAGVPSATIQRIRSLTDMDDYHSMLRNVFDDMIAKEQFALENGPEANREAVGDRINLLKNAAIDVTNILDKSNKIKKEGYFPLMRFGRFTVDAVDAAGDRLYFGLFENKADAVAMKRALGAEYPNAKVEAGTLNPDEFKLFRGIDLNSLELFLKEAGLDTDPVAQEYLKRTVNNNSALKRLIHRKNIPGFSKDVKRVLANFITSNARLSSRNYHWGEMLDAVKAIPKQKGDLARMATNLYDYLGNPQEEFAGLRGFLFFNYLGGSVASAVVNLTQIPMVTLPYLNQFASVPAVSKALLKWYKAKPEDANHKAALEKARNEGVVEPQEIYNLMAAAQAGSGALSKLTGTTPYQSAMYVWGSFFSMAERINRYVAFNAAYEIAASKGMKDPYAFAVKAVEETQFIYGKANRPVIGRGLGAPFLTFKMYTISYLELLSRLPVRQRALALAILTLAAGASGLPGEDDLFDLLDTLAQWVPGADRLFSTNNRRAINDWAVEQLGQYAPFIMKGIAAGAPIDIAGRLGMENIIPGSGIFKQSETDRTRDIAEALGPAGGVARNLSLALGAAARGDVGGAAYTVLPNALKAAVQGLDMATTGEYRDAKGRRVADVTGYDAFARFFGFMPAEVSSLQERKYLLQQDINLQRTKEQGIADQWARGIVDKKQDAIREARLALREWNRAHPELQIAIRQDQIARRVRELRRTTEQRFIKATPPELRGRVGESL